MAFVDATAGGETDLVAEAEGGEPTAGPATDVVGALTVPAGGAFAIVAFGAFRGPTAGAVEELGELGTLDIVPLPLAARGANGATAAGGIFILYDFGGTGASAASIFELEALFCVDW